MTRSAVVERVGVAEVLFELPVGVLVVVGVVGPPERVHVPRHRGEVVEHAGQGPGVITRRLRLVHRIGHGDAAVGRAPHQEVLRLGADTHGVAALGQPLDLAAQDDAGRVRPRLAQHVGIALNDPEPRLPWRRHVRAQVRHGEDVGRRGRLPHRSRREAGEPRPVGQQAVDGGDRDHLGAGLAVHVHEHGEEELDAVPPRRLGQLRRVRDRGRRSLQRARQGRSPPVCGFRLSGFVSTMLPHGKREMVTGSFRSVACRLTDSRRSST